MSRLMRTRGVPPMVSVMSLKIRPWGLRGMGLFRLVCSDQVCGATHFAGFDA
jgi:hypothetical protein